MNLRNNHVGSNASPCAAARLSTPLAQLISSLLIGTALLSNAALAADDDTIATDRPDFVESSNVVGKQRVQVETSVAFERNSDAGVRERTSSTPTLVRVGMSDTLELRLESDGRMRTRVTGEAAYSGTADASFGVKWHALDAAGRAPSVGVLIHADLPSGSARLRGHGVRPSARLVAEWELPDDFSVGVMPGLSYESDEPGKRHVNGIVGLVLGKELTERVRGFVEIAAPQIARARDGGSVVTFNTGVAYLLTPHCQIDTALSRGLNARTPDLSWTVGLSFKL